MPDQLPGSGADPLEAAFPLTADERARLEAAFPNDTGESVARLTNAFSKQVENRAAAVALYFMYYNFGRVHQTLRVTPAMEAGVANHVWSIVQIVGLLV
jgi:nicotinamide mononucleotide adenylyltransferase